MITKAFTVLAPLILVVFTGGAFRDIAPTPFLPMDPGPVIEGGCFKFEDANCLDFANSVLRDQPCADSGCKGQIINNQIIWSGCIGGELRTEFANLPIINARNDSGVIGTVGRKHRFLNMSICGFALTCDCVDDLNDPTGRRCGEIQRNPILIPIWEPLPNAPDCVVPGTSGNDF